jgi:hypothetical protein
VEVKRQARKQREQDAVAAAAAAKRPVGRPKGSGKTRDVQRARAARLCGEGEVVGVDP